MYIFHFASLALATSFFLASLAVWRRLEPYSFCWYTIFFRHFLCVVGRHRCAAAAAAASTHLSCANVMALNNEMVVWCFISPSALSLLCARCQCLRMELNAFHDIFFLNYPIPEQWVKWVAVACTSVHITSSRLQPLSVSVVNISSFSSKWNGNGIALHVFISLPGWYHRQQQCKYIFNCYLSRSRNIYFQFYARASATQFSVCVSLVIFFLWLQTTFVHLHSQLAHTFRRPAHAARKIKIYSRRNRRRKKGNETWNKNRTETNIRCWTNFALSLRARFPKNPFNRAKCCADEEITICRCELWQVASAKSIE